MRIVFTKAILLSIAIMTVSAYAERTSRPPSACPNVQSGRGSDGMGGDPTINFSNER